MTGKIFHNAGELRSFLKNDHGIVVVEEEKQIFVAFDEQGDLNNPHACKKLQSNLGGAIYLNAENNKKIFFVKKGKNKKCKREENSIFCKECGLPGVFANLMAI